MAEHQEGALPGVEGVRIFHQSWRPQAVRAVVVLAHGASEHSGRYEWTAERLAERGYATYALDHRGHGRSEGVRAYIDRMDNAVADLDALVHIAAGDQADVPVFLLGHSMGGCVALAYAIAHQDKLDGLLLSAPVAVLEAASLPTRVAGQVLSVIAPRLGVFDIDSTAVSRDPEVVRAYDADPLNYHGKLPARTVAELASTVARFPEALPRLTLPLLVMHGTADRLVPPAASDLVNERVGSEDKTYLRYPDLFHEILNEPERDQVVGDIADWLDERT
ncbi:MAG: acylglycerol lipase [Thermoleophilaceae bacterium]|nr:acylglycerol lipase [Thermoleophilaceae bacterium]